MESHPQQRLTSAENRRLALCACAGLFLCPGAWLLQVIISETISAQSCYPGRAPRAAPLLTHLHAWLYGISAVAVLISMTCVALATYGFVFLRNKRKQIKAAREDGTAPEQPSRDEEQVARKRFIAVCSVLIGCAFLVGLVFSIFAEVFLISCNQWR
ncbi:hypothetical protein BZM26_29525 [Paraburkholderia strydomiana]|nr:hypothetical protein BZM26_29525 [Paraburkholderia strydomiana]